MYFPLVSLVLFASSHLLSKNIENLTSSSDPLVVDQVVQLQQKMQSDQSCDTGEFDTTIPSNISAIRLHPQDQNVLAIGGNKLMIINRELKQVTKTIELPKRAVDRCLVTNIFCTDATHILFDCIESSHESGQQALKEYDRYIALVDVDTCLYVWVDVRRQSNGTSPHLDVSPSGQFYITNLVNVENKTISVRCVKENSVVKTVKVNRYVGHVGPLAFSPDTTHMAVGVGGVIYVYNIDLRDERNDVVESVESSRCFYLSFDKVEQVKWQSNSRYCVLFSRSGKGAGTEYEWFDLGQEKTVYRLENEGAEDDVIESILLTRCCPRFNLISDDCSVVAFVPPQRKGDKGVHKIWTSIPIPEKGFADEKWIGILNSELYFDGNFAQFTKDNKRLLVGTMGSGLVELDVIWSGYWYWFPNVNKTVN